MWSPQLYKDEGLKHGYAEQLLEAAISQSNSLLHANIALPSILSLRHLAERTGVSHNQLRDFVNRTDYQAYKKFSIRKRSGGRRFIHVPSPQLLLVQRWLNEFLLKPVPVHHSSHAFTVGDSIKNCALKHCGSKWLIKLDIQDFFESISEIQVFRIFKELGYQPLVAFELGRLCTISTASFSPRNVYKHWHVRMPNKAIPEYSQKTLGYLPQGAATSPLISNLAMRVCDQKLDLIAKKFQLTYTRYSDDLTFSTRSKAFNRANAKEVIYEVYKILSENGYLPQYRKTKIVPPSSKKIILGLNVDGAEPRLQKEFKDRIRQHLYYVKKLGLSEHVSNREFDSIWGFKSHLRGMIDYANMIEPQYANEILREFLEVDWPV